MICHIGKEVGYIQTPYHFTSSLGVSTQILVFLMCVLGGLGRGRKTSQKQYPTDDCSKIFVAPQELIYLLYNQPFFK